MELTDLLAIVRERDIVLWAEGEKLRYDAPKGALTPDLRERLAEHRAEVLEFLRTARSFAAEPATSGPMAVVDRDGPHLASFAQERLLFLQELAPESPYYNVPIALRLRGRLEVSALEESLGRLVERHETLRTTFRSGRQVVGSPRSTALARIDLRGLPLDAREREARRLANAEAARLFDLARGPLVRARLFRLAEDEHLLSLTLHHIISDGWSMGVLLRDMAEIYDALVSRRRPALGELRAQYLDFAAWQRGTLTGDVLDRHVTFWRRKLDNLEPLDLPTDRPRPASLRYAGARAWHVLSPDLVSGLRTLARSEDVTLYTLLLAAFFVLLHRYTGQEDLAVGSPFAGRTRPELEDLIGFFVNSLVMRVDVSSDPSFRALLGRVGSVTKDALEHSDVPFEKIVETMDPDRELGQNPFFQVVFALQNTPPTALPMGDLRLEWGWAETGATRFDLEAHVWDDGSSLTLAFVYSTEIFDLSTIRRMEAHYERLLRSVVRSPGARISDLTYLDDEERAGLVAWSRASSSSSFRNDSTIAELFEEQARERPNAVALSHRSGSMTYGELDLRSSRLARLLRRRGVGAETRVAIACERGPELVVALLGVLKAGGAYVPLDPELPEERRLFVLADTESRALMTRAELAPRFAGYAGVLLVFEEIEAEIAEGPLDPEPESERVPDLAHAESLAYVTYTSGSTGQPKGVAIAHRGVVRLVKDTDYVELGPEDVVLQLAPVSFDASTFEIWGSLLNGARLVLYPSETPTLEELASVLRAEGVTVLWLTGSLFHQMVENERESLASVGTLLAGGEALSPSHVKRMLDVLAPGCRLVNGYGPTEGTTFTCCHPMTRETAPSELTPSVPIGRPIANTRVYLLDRYGEPVPIGVPGELHLGGGGLARGYLGRPELTAERFVPDPFAIESGARLYATGDFCRYRRDGTIEFLGRKDDQVKIRGFRVELAEIETRLREAAEIQDAVVLARRDTTADTRLVAYVTTAAGGELHGPDDEQAHVAEWEDLFDQTYRDASPAESGAPDFTGWNSSYTGEPIPSEEMSEWLDGIVERILSFRPDRVLEIGCGTGLLVERIAPFCARYLGTDFSASVIAKLESKLATRESLSHVTLLERDAADSSGIEGESFDTVILNSVVQYFPSADYLARVLEGALPRLSPGGRIVVGDVRCLPLLEAFHASVSLERSVGSDTRESLRHRIAESLEDESELVLAPAFFLALPRRFSRITDVEVLLKEGRHENELSKFRYDVVLHVGPVARAPDVGRWLEWERDSLALGDLEAALAVGESFGVRGIPNSRLAKEEALLSWLTREGGTDTVEGFRIELAARDSETLELAAISRAARDRGYHLELTYSSEGNDRVDALFRPMEERNRFAVFWSMAPASEDEREKANRPLGARRARSLAARLRQHLKERLPDYMIPASFVLLESLPVGPTGKLDRRALPSPSRARAARAGLPEKYRAPRSRVEKLLVRIWTDVLRLDRVGIHDNFFELGGDSILGIQVAARAREEGLGLAVRQLFEHQSVADLAASIGPSRARPNEPPPEVGPVPLTPIQHWFFEQCLSEPHHFNQAVVLALRSPIDAERIRRAVGRLVEQHDALRLRYRHDAGPGTTRQELVPFDGEAPFETVGLGDRSLTAVASDVQRGLDLEQGPLMRAVLVRGDETTPARVILVAHHLAVDVVSWRVLLEDLEHLVQEPEAKLSRTTAFATWSRQLTRFARSRDFSDELPFWLAQGQASIPPLPRDVAETGPSVQSLDRVVETVGEAETESLLRRSSGRAASELTEYVLTALGLAFSSWTHEPKLRLSLEGHGREELFEGPDLSRTVGWFTSLYPIVLDAESTSDPRAVLDGVKKTLRAVPSSGVSFGLLRYLRREPRLASFPRPEVSFSYLGQLDATFSSSAIFEAVDEDVGPSQSPTGRRAHLIDVTARIRRGRLTVHFYYSRSVHHRETIEALATGFGANLRRLLGNFLPEFPEARLEPGQWEAIETRYGADVVADVYRLSPMQRGMLFESFYQPDASVYVEQYALELSELDPRAFVQAWQRVVSRHTALRTSVVGTGWDEPHQIVFEEVALPVEEHDLRGLDLEEQQVWLERHRARDRERGIDLESPPLMRLALFALGEGRYECLWTFHHIILDGWSVPLVLGEVFQLYQSSRRGEDLALPAPPSFRSFIGWLGRQSSAAAERYWRERLRGVESATPLPLASASRQARSSTKEYGEERRVLSPLVTEKVRAAAARYRVTVNTLVLGAWSILLSRYAGEEDIVLGTTVSGRPADLEGVESIVGLFINTLPLRVRVDPETPVESFLRELQARQLEQREYEHSPLWQVQQWSDVPAGASLFETFFVFENYPAEAMRLIESSDLKGRSKPSVERSGYPLALAAGLRDELVLRLFYDCDRFEPDAVGALATRLERALEAISAAASSRSVSLSKLNLLGEDERRALLGPWSEGATGAALESSPIETVVELIEEVARRAPDSVALVDKGVTIRYGELNARADQLARRLAARGVGAEAIVAVHLERGWELVVAKLAVWKTGGAYLPLDPDTPRLHQELVLDDARPLAIVTRGTQDWLSESELLVRLDEEDREGASVSTPGPHIDGLAYVIYTSGSTGRPKGVQVSHRSLANLVRWHNEAYGITEHDRASQVAASTFDACAWEIWPHLVAGASLYVLDDETRSDPAKLWDAIARLGITICFLPTPLAEAALAEREHERPEGLSLRVLLTGGDELGRVAPDARLRFVNHYGLTETTVVATAGDVGAVAPPPIGRPISGLRVYLVDASLELVPPGARGEIVVGGLGVARGYLNRPDLTAERFVPDPFSSSPGARLYRTGDLGHHLPDGSVAFLGRADRQVQIRGFRVELAEIEHVLSTYPGVEEAAVVLRDDGERKRLVAYVRTGDPGSSEGALRAYLSERLPPQMVPAAVVALDAFPLTPNGKIDRKRLPAPDATSERERVAPRSSIEIRLAELWAEVLRVPTPGVHDNFFEIGGDSILSIQLVARSRDHGLSFSAKDVFQHPTIADLAAVVDRSVETAAAVATEVDVEGPIPLTPIQRWFFDQALPEPHHFNQPLLLTSNELVDHDRLEHALGVVVEHHEALRFRYRDEGSEWRQERDPSGSKATFVVIDLRALRPEARRAAMVRQASALQASLRLDRGPLFRAALFDFGVDEPGRLLLIAHHLVVDAVSWRVLLEDLERVLSSRDTPEHERVSLPKTTPFSVWARALLDHATSGDLSRALEFYRALDPAPCARLPRDSATVANDVAGLEQLSVSLDAGETEALLHRAPGAYNTRVNEILIAALVDCFAGYTGKRRTWLTLEGHGREALFPGMDVSRTVGWFTTMFPVLLDLNGARGPGDALKLVKEQLRAVPERGLAYGLLRYVSRDEQARSLLAKLPVPEVSFNYLGRLDTVDGSSPFLSRSSEPVGPTRSPLGRRLHLLDIVAAVVTGELQIQWVFHREIHRRETVQRMAERFLALLRSLMAHCLEPGAEGYTPSDFSLSGLSKAQLDQLMKQKSRGSS